MATLRVSCPCCGDITIGTGDLRLVGMPDGKKYYSFMCISPNHPEGVTDDEGAAVSKLIIKQAEERTWELLINSGSPFKVLTEPEELLDIRRVPETNPPLDPDALLEMHTQYFDGIEYELDRRIVGEPTESAILTFNAAFEGMSSHYPSAQLREEYPGLNRMRPGKER